MQEPEEYKFKELPLTPIMAEDIILKLFEGKIVERKTIVENVLDFHLSNGGMKPNRVNYIGPIKKALRTLASKGLAANPATGYWKIGTSKEFVADSTEDNNYLLT